MTCVNLCLWLWLHGHKQGVVTHVEVFATRIEIESNDQSPLGTDQGIKVTYKLLEVNNQERTAAISSDQAHFLPIKKLDRGHKRFYR